MAPNNMDSTMMVNNNNNENHCPNIAVLRRKKGKVTTIVQLLNDTNQRIAGAKQYCKQTDDALSKASRVSSTKNNSIIIDNTNNNKQHNDDNDNNNNNNNKHNEKEARRKIMLQERRMEKALSQKSLTSPAVGEVVAIVERSLSVDFVNEVIVDCSKEERKGQDMDTGIRNSGVIQCGVNALTLEEETTPSSSGTSRWILLSRALLVSLTFYQVQLHCSTTASMLSLTASYIQHSMEQILARMDSFVAISGNFLVLRLICDLHKKAVSSLNHSITSLSWEEVLHIAFVGTFLVRGVIASCNWASKCQEKTRARWWLKRTFLFLFSALCWTMILPLYSKCNSDSSKYCFFTATKVISSPRYSWLDVMAVKFYKSLSVILKTKIKGRLLREARRAFVNPFRFHGRLKKLFTIIRWAKFLAPLIGTCNKLRGHILDMMKKKGQHLTSKSARKMWSDLMEALTSQSKQERAVLQLQKSFREMRERKAKRRMELISFDRPSARHIRQQLRVERNLSKSKLLKMEMLDSERKLRRQVSEQEKANIHKHKESRKREKKRLLLSPKTAFALGWKYMAISCVILEVSQMICAPLLSGELKKMPLDQFLSVLLFASCNEKKSKDFCVASPWKHNWLLAVHLFSRILIAFVHAVCFLDVFVTFSTGELTPTGKLVPKPFFTRYILPGIGLQLIVNPTMMALSKLVKTAILYSIHVGPSLCFHLILVCLPLVHWIYDLLLDIVIDFVEKQNKILSKRSLNIF